MRLDRATVETWSADKLLEEYERRDEGRDDEDYKMLCLADMEDVLALDIELIGSVCYNRWFCHPGWLVELGHARRTFTDRANVVHNWRGRLTHGAGYGKRDRPTKPVTCIACIARFS